MTSKMSIRRIERQRGVGVSRRPRVPLSSMLAPGLVTVLTPVLVVGLALGGVPLAAAASDSPGAEPVATPTSSPADPADTSAVERLEAGLAGAISDRLAARGETSAGDTSSDPASAPSDEPTTAPSEDPAATPSAPPTTPPTEPPPPSDGQTTTPAPPTDRPGTDQPGTADPGPAAGAGDPTTDPGAELPSQPPASVPVGGPATSATVPPQTPLPVPKTVWQSTPSQAAATAARAAAARAAAARTAAFIAAQTRVAEATSAYDSAKLAYASLKARYDEASARAELVRSLADEAATTAANSHRVISTIVRAVAQQQNGTGAVDVLLDGRDAGNLIYQLGTLDKLSQLTGNLPALRERAEADQKRADTLLNQEDAAQQLVASIPLADAQTRMEAAKSTFDRASADLNALRSSTPAGLLELAPLPVVDARDVGQLSSQGWTAPAIGTITDVFGPRPSLPLPGVGAFHYGTDIGAACSAGIYAATSGVVVAAGPLGTYGNWILIDHGDGIQTGYAHVADGETLVSVGESVIAGQVIAGVGSTGASTGCHLHFEVRINGNRVDAQPFMAQRGVILGESAVLAPTGTDQ